MIGHISLFDVNSALGVVLPMLLRHGNRHTAASVANARPTIEWPGTFITEYCRPDRCVLFDPVRDANPFFHYLEAMWIIAGQNDVAFLKQLLPRMADYSDDGKTFHGAYGWRLRHGFMFDQIEASLAVLAKEPASRQVVMSIWDPTADLGQKTKDMPCNDMIMLKVRDGKLHFTVNNRSNDVILGCYGANVVQFSMMQMYMAARLGLRVGTYTQVSNSFHVYEDNPYWKWFLSQDSTAMTKYVTEQTRHYTGLGDVNLFENGAEHVDDDLDSFFNSFGYMTNTDLFAAGDYKSQAVGDAARIYNTLMLHRAGNPAEALRAASCIVASDWREACTAWLLRRAALKKVAA